MKSILKKQVILKLNYPTYIQTFSAPKPNVIKFVNKQNDILTDKDIVSMFLAFVNLIKKNTLLKYETMYRNKTKILTDRLNNCLNQLKMKDKIIKSLTANNGE